MATFRQPACLQTRPPAQIICMKWGTPYSAEDVNRLHAGVRRHLSRPFRFLCFTEDPFGLDPEIEAHVLPPIHLPPGTEWTPWRKLSVWQVPLANLSGDVLFLDLDMVITGPLDDLFDYAPGRFCVIENWTQTGRGIGNTSVFRFTIGQHAYVFEDFEADPLTVCSAYDNEQVYVSQRIGDPTFWPADWCVSFKHSLMPKFPLNWIRAPKLPETAKVVVFHGFPKPQQAELGEWPAPIHKRLFKHVKPTPWIGEH